MKILRFITKYSTRILLYVFLLAFIFVFVSIYNKGYNQRAEKIKDIDVLSDCTCLIESFAERGNGNFSFDASIISSEHEELENLKMHIVLKNADYDFLPGDTLRLNSGKLYVPSVKNNVGSFDEIEYKKSQNIYGNIYYETKPQLVQKGKDIFLKKVARLRNKFEKNSAELLGQRYSGIANALFAGDKSGIYKEDANNLKKSGVYHIVAISGLHLNIFIMFLGVFVSRLKMKRLKKALLSAFLSIVTSLAVLIFTGFGLSVIRAFVMLVIFLGSSVFARKYDSKNSLIMATAIILVLIPQSFFSIGFRLSVFSTYGVLVSGGVTSKLKKYSIFSNKLISYAAGVFVTSVLCSAFTLPVMITSFGFMPLYSFVANLFILPLATPALALCALFAVFSFLGLGFGAKLISYPLTLVIWAITKIAGIVATVPCSVLNLYPLYTFYAVCFIGIFACGIMCVIKRKTGFFVGTSLILALAVGSVLLYNNKDNSARVVFADVGQGECCLIMLPHNQAVMIDFGTNYATEYVTEEIKASLVKYNIRKLSALFVSHFHTDHISGAVSLLNDKRADMLIVPQYYDKKDKESRINYNELLAASLRKPAKLHKLKQGDRAEIGDAVFEVLSPCGGMEGGANDMSLVIKFTYGDVSFLLTGDITDEGIKNIINENIECDVIKIPHHGGKSELSRKLAKKAKAKYAVISCGKNNSYKHPHKSTIAEFEDAGTNIYRTDTMGAVSFEFDKKEIKKVKKMR